MQKNFPPNTPLYFGKVFEVPRNFLQKVSCVGVPRRTAPTYLSYKKGKPKNFPPNTSLYFGEAFEIPKDFSRKVLCVRVPRQTAPTDNAYKKILGLINI